MRLFGTDGIRAKAGIYPLDAQSVKQLGLAFSQFLSGGKKKALIAIARDTRASGSMIEAALSEGILSRADVILLGVLPTNALSKLVSEYHADGGIMITASHNPAEDNGLKFFNSQGIKFTDVEEEQIEGLFFSNIAPAAMGKIMRVEEAEQRYIAYLNSTVPGLSLSGVNIVVDCANGAASHVAKELFMIFNAKATIFHNMPEGTNINEGCGALHPEFMAKEVVMLEADIGLALDGDADRAVFADEKGRILTGDQIMAIFAADLKHNGSLAGNAIVVTDYSNLALDEAMREKGIKVVRTQNGDRYVLEEMIKKGYNFGGEQSGHFIMLDHAKGGDGLLICLQLLRIMKQTGKKLSELASLQLYPQLAVNLPIRQKKPLEQLTLVGLAKTLEAKIAGRVFIRYSGTENLLRIMAEGKNEKELKAAIIELEIQAKMELN
jgi:phosphoglucosamine mutase